MIQAANILFLHFLIIILPVVFLAAAIIVMLLSFFLTSAVIRPPRRSLQEAHDYHIANNGIPPDYYAGLTREACEFISSQGFILQGEWIRPKRASRKYLVFVHGHGHNRMGALKYLPYFIAKDFNVLIYDQINSGESEGHYCTMGLVESRDLKLIIDRIFEQYKPDLLGLCGESMGAATVLMEAAKDCRPDFVISDCAFADLQEQLVYRLKAAYRLGSFPLLGLSSRLAKLRCGLRWQDISPEAAITGSSCLSSKPLLFVHGSNDSYIPYQSSVKLQAACPDNSELLIVEGARHTESICINQKVYYEALDRLLSKTVSD